MRLACAATLLILLVCTAPARAAFPPPSITSFEIIHEGNAPAPDEGNTVVRVGYDFPGNPADGERSESTSSFATPAEQGSVTIDGQSCWLPGCAAAA